VSRPVVQKSACMWHSTLPTCQTRHMSCIAAAGARGLTRRGQAATDICSRAPPALMDCPRWRMRCQWHSSPARMCETYTLRLTHLRHQRLASAWLLVRSLRCARNPTKCQARPHPTLDSPCCTAHAPQRTVRRTRKKVRAPARRAAHSVFFSTLRRMFCSAGTRSTNLLTSVDAES
jgi:hypothetical protein